MHGQPLLADADLGDLEALEGVQRFPVRVKCAMLPWVTLLDAIKSWRAGRPCSRTSTESE
jgi:nitrogen fixation NifU-like protein